ncbi:hypothetical protein, partial [Rhodanobacter sp. C06]|uniref:hypothetical protein n=1 Tax=Rhodanobacter sp. C06 TaxID=1945854 RepID=UPI001C2C5A44
DRYIREHAKLLDVGAAHRIGRSVIENVYDRGGARRFLNSLLANNATYLDLNQLPAILALFEGNVSRVYNDGKDIPTIGIGMNLTNSNNMALVLYEMAPSLFENSPAGSTTQQIVAAFEQVIKNNPLSGPADGLKGDLPNASTIKLYDALNAELVHYLGQLPAITFSTFPADDALDAMKNAIMGGAIIPNYSNIPGYGPGTLAWLQGGNPYGIDVTSNIPSQNTTAWEALGKL